MLTGVVSTALKVLTTNAQCAQSTELVVVTVERYTVLVASNGSSKTGCSVVHVDCAEALNAARRKRKKKVMGAAIAARPNDSSRRGLC